MKQIELTARLRSRSGKGAAHAIRKAGNVPAILYGKDLGAQVLIELDAKETARLLAGHHGHPVVNLKVAGGDSPREYLAMVTEVQRDIYQKVLYHIDFHRVSMHELVRSTLGLQFHGHPAGEKNGGVTEYMKRELDVEGTPMSIPEQLTVEVGAIEVGHGLHVRDLVVPEGLRILNDPDEMVLVVHPPRTSEEAPAAEAAEGSAPAAGKETA